MWDSRIKEADTPHIYSIANKFPAFAPEVTLEETGHDFYTDDSSVGVHEVIVLKRPEDSLYAIGQKRLLELLQFLQRRMLFHEKDHTLRSFTPIYNHGHEAGASVAHPHAQFFISSIVSPRLSKEFFGTDQYFQKHHACVFCDMVSFEVKQNSRVVSRDSGAVAFCTYAPRFPFETWIVPTKHFGSFSQASTVSLESVASVLHDTLKRFKKTLGSPSLNWYIHTARSVDAEQQISYHWHIEILPRISNYGGFELSSDMIIGTVLPEMAAQYLRG